MTKTSKTAKISKALKEMRQSARAEIARRHVLHFRIDKTNIAAVYKVAAEKKVPVGSMIRDWVLDRLAQEQDHASKLAPDRISELEMRMAILEKKIDTKR